MTPAQAAFLVAGAALIVGCFFAAQNIAYRAIFLLMTLPGLVALARADADRRRSRILLIAGVLFVMWEEFFHHQATALQPAMANVILPAAAEFTFWLIRETVWWWVIARLAALLAAFALSTPLGAVMRREVSRRRA